MKWTEAPIGGVDRTSELMTPSSGWLLCSFEDLIAISVNIEPFQRERLNKEGMIGERNIAKTTTPAPTAVLCRLSRPLP